MALENNKPHLAWQMRLSTIANEPPIAGRPGVAEEKLLKRIPRNRSKFLEFTLTAMKTAAKAPTAIHAIAIGSSLRFNTLWSKCLYGITQEFDTLFWGTIPIAL